MFDALDEVGMEFGEDIEEDEFIVERDGFCHSYF